MKLNSIFSPPPPKYEYDRTSSSRTGGYGHSYSEKHGRTPDNMPPGASAASTNSWKIIDTLRDLPNTYPTSQFDQNSVAKPIGLKQRQIELQDKGYSTKNIDKTYKESMNDLYQATAKAQGSPPNEIERNRLTNWSDKVLETNQYSPFLK